MQNGDSLSDIPWPVFTEDDYRHIDQICEEASSSKVTESDDGAPRVFIELVPSTDNNILKTSHDPKPSPFELFRKKNYLTVSDITSPTWCELQYDYGLRQSRHKPLKRRPESFVSEKGKEIHVNIPVAAKREKIAEKGKKVHLIIEKEIHKEKVKVDVRSAEEMWALRFLDTLVRLRVFKDLGVCREVPVWGVLQKHAIVGTIDELRLPTETSQSTTEDSSTSPHSRKKEDESQEILDGFVSPGKGKKDTAHGTSSRKLSVAQISDSKTRQGNSIPLHIDTQPARLQLMLYWRLFLEVTTFDATKAKNFFDHLGLDPQRKFSETFKNEMALITIDSDLSLLFLDATCLQDMIEPFSESIKILRIRNDADTALRLVYRRRGRVTKKRRIEATAAPENVHAPMNDSLSTNENAASDSGKEATSTLPDHTIKTDNIGSGGATSPGSKKRKRSESSSASSSGSESEGSASDNGDGTSHVTKAKAELHPIIGTKKFTYKENFLNSRLESVLRWWHGKRPPKGVEIEESHRCASCEYRDGCEWREEKAKEFMKIAQARNSKNISLPTEDKNTNTG